MTLTIEIQPELASQIQAEAAKAGLDADVFVKEALEEKLHRVKRRAKSTRPRLSAEEAELLQKVNIGLSEETWLRYRELIAKRRDETLTPEEHGELIALTNLAEIENAKRLGYLAELARLRQVSLPEVMKQLGIKTPGYE